jgi:hypothetical protein
VTLLVLPLILLLSLLILLPAVPTVAPPDTGATCGIVAAAFGV